MELDVLRSFECCWPRPNSFFAVIHHAPLRARPFSIQSIDPAEEHALNISDPDHAAVVASMLLSRDAKLADINMTMQSTVDWSTSNDGRAVNCCNSTNMECSCEVW
mmetsp:Transcript_54378/g.149824  ORF Transcript_54378/g.149824 Transcript_54378/m.149824 type:complete len:106 (+) Transcript_54378:45-362(+)